MLDHTPAEVTSRKALRVNPAKTCQPIGAMYAALGIHRCLPHSHGSQGCCSYHRSHLTRHFKEPVMASTSSFTEGASVFGGSPNLRQSLKTIFQAYDPDVVAVHTTCLSETIGDDIPTIVKKAEDDGIVPRGKKVIHASTPSYVGSHVTGFSNMVKGIASYFTHPAEHKIKDQINVLPGYVEPADMRKIKSMVSEMGLKQLVFPDTSDVLDTPKTGEYSMYPKGGIKMQELEQTGNSLHTIAMGHFSSLEAATYMDQKAGVPFTLCDIPIGVQATDRFVQAVMDATGASPTQAMLDDRGRLVDMMTDYQHYLYGKKVALWGDPDQIISMAEFMVSMGMQPVYVLTGTPGKAFEKRMKKILNDTVPNAVFGHSQDLFYLHQLIKQEPVDLLVGNTYGKYIARAEDIPFVRFGFPILDRTGHSYFPSVGYKGGMHFLSAMINTLLERMDRDSPDECFELVL
ncbi:nitrogenase molybdenum-iron protein beta chain [Desulfonatronospira thiodismutans ASO3-1]|uniref:Nitrogenase molybdenum-iron protein beta chain n=1 Tax=Desulfonatronospira thiodismutans ASO3-1 TaxID=555779 RepID=D6SLD6_9BACT|nr:MULTISPECIES: nitrogenase molybdenum-iron protein subunit beta [Desulfonatronospira]EFI35497.1 nitrogenase molybdenum-iron protein beta chain [Desulfonatronospira thiodismutans ASO3-1]RQD77616.1 MAG: nitrogenase molybdenum-iron protein subunit beta [Desulfonatronospira sp. MSAO_Bac3]